MAIRIDAGSDNLSLASQTNGAQTVMGWYYIVNDRSAFSCFICSDDFNSIYAGIDSSRIITPFVGGSAITTGSTLNVAQWYHFCYTIDATGEDGDFNIYLDGALDINATVDWPAGTDTLEFGNDPDDEWLDGRIAYMKKWNAELTQSEVQQEMSIIRPNRTEDLVGWWPTYFGATERLRDYSGNGNDLTEAGTLTDEAPPGISYGGNNVQYIVAAAAVGGNGLLLLNQANSL